MRETLTTKRVAEILNLKEWTIREYLRTGKLQGFKIKGSHLWHIPANELERLMKEPNHAREN